MSKDQQVTIFIFSAFQISSLLLIICLFFTHIVFSLQVTYIAIHGFLQATFYIFILSSRYCFLIFLYFIYLVQIVCTGCSILIYSVFTFLQALRGLLAVLLCSTKQQFGQGNNHAVAYFIVYLQLLFLACCRAYARLVSCIIIALCCCIVALLQILYSPACGSPRSLCLLVTLLAQLAFVYDYMLLLSVYLFILVYYQAQHYAVAFLLCLVALLLIQPPLHMYPVFLLFVAAAVVSISCLAPLCAHVLVFLLLHGQGAPLELFVVFYMLCGLYPRGTIGITLFGARVRPHLADLCCLVWDLVYCIIVQHWQLEMGHTLAISNCFQT